MSHSRKSKRRFRRFLPTRPREIVAIAVTITIATGILFYFRYPMNRREVTNSDIPFSTENVDDSNIELGQQQTRTNGENGVKETTYTVRRTLAGKEVSRTVASEKTIKYATPKTVANGTKKYQFMWCSNGAYRYYTNDEFKNKYTGFTHQSPDYCAQNNEGHMTSLSDSAPATQSPQYRAPTTTHCYDTGLYSSSFSCYSY